jgi:hypothetical protein
MPKKSAAHRDKWTLELLRDAAQRPSTASHLGKFTELFSNGALPKNLRTCLALALMYPFHKLMLEIYLLKTLQKSPHTAQWMREMDDAHVSTWLYCLTASTGLENAIGLLAKDQLAGMIDLPPALGGIGLQSLERSADEELLGSFARIFAPLIAFCRSTELLVYIAIAEALEGMDDAAELLISGEKDPTPPSILQVREVAARTMPPPLMPLSPSLRSS